MTVVLDDSMKYGPYVSPAQVQTMYDRIATCRELWLQCSAAGTPQAALDALSRAIDSLALRTAKVHSGEHSYARWLAEADDYIRVWRTEPAEQLENSTTRILANVLRETGSTVVEGGAEIVAAAKSGWVWGLVFVAIGLFAYSRLK